MTSREGWDSLGIAGRLRLAWTAAWCSTTKCHVAPGAVMAHFHEHQPWDVSWGDDAMVVLATCPTKALRDRWSLHLRCPHVPGEQGSEEIMNQ